ncbi:sce7726 family protein [Atopobium sp. oral taxon 810]|uniref:sce7726 family protein n=1 Tax=Atopobium sp. oral taxon 810 TaxID=712158 RepID=UPI00041A4DF6|nr:sce7726 family protein [Atopobium sp. oral taxon 810]
MDTKSVYSTEEAQAAKQLYDAYSTVHSETKLASILSSILNGAVADFTPAKSARDAINQIVLRYYPNEATIKANFINRELLPLNPKNISIFELPIGKSRVDICKVNGHSAAYEIKTELDTFYRLEGQLADYFDVFETVYVVVSETRVNELPAYVPEACGIYTYRQEDIDGSYVFHVYRKAIKRHDLDPVKQLSAMPKKDLCRLFGLDGKGVTKTALIQQCVDAYSPKWINTQFKRYLKQRYGAYWSRFRENCSDMYEIDYEWFYRSRLEPSLIY